MATTVTVQEAKSQLTELIHLAEQGEEVSSQNLMVMKFQQQFDGLPLRATRV
jgi:hypothetical protein